MTIQELIDWCKTEGVSFDTHIAVRAKDDYLIVENRVYLDRAYFGNCREGTKWEKKNTPKVDEELDYDNTPEVLILDSESG